MAQDIFIKIQGIEGESQDATHLNEIDVIDWTWKVAQQPPVVSGSHSSAAKASVSDLEFTHQTDRASPSLAQYCFTGKHIPEATLTMRKSGGFPHEFMRITLSDVIVSCVEPFADMNGCIEAVRLSFTRMKKEYLLQNTMGGNAGTVTALIDIKQKILR